MKTFEQDEALRILETFRSLQVWRVLPLIKNYHSDVLVDLQFMYQQWITTKRLPEYFVLYVSDRGTHSWYPELRKDDMAGEHIHDFSGRMNETYALVFKLAKEDKYSEKLIYVVDHKLEFNEFYQNKDKYLPASLL